MTKWVYILVDKTDNWQNKNYLSTHLTLEGAYDAYLNQVENYTERDKGLVEVRKEVLYD